MVAVGFPEAGCVGIHEACVVFCQLLVYGKCMTRTNIDIDDRACTEIMRRYQFETKREAVNFALQTLASEAMTLEEAALASVGAVGKATLTRCVLTVRRDIDRHVGMDRVS